jgi:succinate dehydrogenase / fumarate reductase cytochrome b subunit
VPALTSVAIVIRAFLRGFPPARDLDVTRSFSYFSSAMERESYTKAIALRKLHALSGVVPLGVFLVEYLWSSARVLRNDRTFSVDGPSRWLPFLEIAVILLPLAFHVLYSSHVLSEPRSRRVTGFAALAFVGLYLWELRGQQLVHGLANDAFYDVLAGRLSSTTSGLPLWALVYLVGVGATVFHFASGVAGFSAAWGNATETSPAQARASWVPLALGVVLFCMGANTVLSFATGSRFGLAADNTPSDGPCPPK